jgi:outer membrane protein TolC
MDRWLKVLLGLSSILFTVPGLAAEMTLKELVLYGLEHSPQLKAADARKSSLAIKVASAKADFFPTIYSGVRADVSALRPPGSLTKPAESATLNFGLSQTIWDGGLRSLSLESEELTEAIESLEHQRFRDELSLEIIKAYLTASEASLNVSSLEMQSTYLSTQQVVMADAYRQGMRLKRDYIRMQTELQRHEIQLLQARDLRDQALASLVSKIGMDARSAMNPKLLVPEKTLPLSWFPRLHEPVAAQQTVDGQKDVLSSKMDETQTALARRRNFWPSFDLGVTSQYTPLVWRRDVDRSNFYAKRNQMNWAVELSMKYILWDGGRLRNSLDLALSRAEEGTFSRRARLQELELKLSQIRKSLDQSERSHELNVKLLDLENSAYREVEVDFKQGKVTFLDMLDALQNLLATKQAHARSYFDWIRSSWDMEFYRGDLNEVIQRL